MNICIDPGHGGDDPGAIGRVPFELKEKAVTLKISHFLEEQLERLHHWVALTRRRDTFLKLKSRAESANLLEADLFVSVHANSFENP